MEYAQFKAVVASATTCLREWKNDFIFSASVGSFPPLLSLSDRPCVSESWYKHRG